jgi:hypothetical protein
MASMSKYSFRSNQPMLRCLRFLGSERANPNRTELLETARGQAAAGSNPKPRGFTLKP